MALDAPSQADGATVGERRAARLPPSEAVAVDVDEVVAAHAAVAPRGPIDGALDRHDRLQPLARLPLLDLYEPMVRRITGSLYLPGGEREDLAQEARLGILAAIRAWDPDRSVPFRCFAWLCAVREARMAVSAARAAKHQPLNRARSLHTPIAEDGVPLQDTLVATGQPDDDPVAKTLGRERLPAILAGTRALTELERGALALPANDRTHRDSARELGVGERAVNNALQRARRKLAGPAIR